MRNIVARRKENGADYFLRMVHSRFYVNIKRFFEWFEQQKEPTSAEKSRLDFMYDMVIKVIEEKKGE